MGSPEPRLAQARVLGVVGEDEQAVHRGGLRVVLLGRQQDVEAILAAFLAWQFGAALGAPHGAAAFRPFRASLGMVFLGE